jgi:hypothetical protein
MGRTPTNSQRKETTMPLQSIGYYTKLLLKIQARGTTAKGRQKYMGEEQEEDLTGVCTTSAGQL